MEYRQNLSLYLTKDKSMDCSQENVKKLFFKFLEIAGEIKEGKRFQKKCKKVSCGEARVLELIGDQKILIGQIAKGLEISNPAATQFVQKMVIKKLIKKTVDKNDKRMCHICLTPQGTKALQIYLDCKKEMFDTIPAKIQAAGMSEVEVEKILNLLCDHFGAFLE